jgi:hypothetical protein
MKKNNYKSQDNTVQEVKSSRELVSDAKTVKHPGDTAFIGSINDNSGARNNKFFKYFKLAFFIILSVFIIIVITYVFIKGNNDTKTVSLNSDEVSRQDIKFELNKELNNPVNTSDMDQKKIYYSGILAKLSALGDTDKAADLYVKEIMALNIVFDVQTQEWLISSLVANGYNAEAKKAVNDLLPLLETDFQKIGDEYKTEVIKKINYYKNLENTL